ncbi:uncharacterized protein LOC124498940 [Dermatophagoides farinae]|uniref:uncharacterized protein LOC124498940 n=1 Tax=Dermatophagoides farinae TaxID=6954 RepID=UPI003F6319E2
MSTEIEIDKLTQEIENKLKFYGQDFFTKVKNDSEIFLNYPRHIEEYRQRLKKEYEYTKRMEKLEQKIHLLKSKNETMLQNIEKSTNKISNLKKHISALESEMENKKKTLENIDDTSDFIGLNIYNKSDTLWNVQLFKLPIKNENDDDDRTFSFDIAHVGNNIELKNIYPENCIDTDQIMSEINATADDKKILKLIVLIRSELIRKYS